MWGEGSLLLSRSSMDTLLLDLHQEAGHTFSPFLREQITIVNKNMIHKATRSPEISRQQVQKLTPHFFTAPFHFSIFQNAGNSIIHKLLKKNYLLKKEVESKKSTEKLKNSHVIKWHLMNALCCLQVYSKVKIASYLRRHCINCRKKCMIESV